MKLDLIFSEYGNTYSLVFFPRPTKVNSFDQCAINVLGATIKARLIKSDANKPRRNEAICIEELNENAHENLSNSRKPIFTSFKK